jgi:hypothetical protein
MMVDIAALMKGLPISKLEPNWLARIDGIIDVPKEEAWREKSIWLLEPPAGQRVPYIEPVEVLEKLLRRQGIVLEEAEAQAREIVSRMRDEIADDRWVNFFDSSEPESPECLPMPDFLAWVRDVQCRRAVTEMPQDAQGLKELVGIPSDLLDFFEQAAEVSASTPMFRRLDSCDEDEVWSLENLPPLPPPKSMFVFVPGAPWTNYHKDLEKLNNMDNWGDSGGWKAVYKPFMRWREAMRSVALELEKALGEPVYYFGDLSCETDDDDDVHRFLVLHWCCTFKPESAFVRYLLKISKARDVEELKAALLDPTSYTHPFKMNYTYLGMETLNCWFKYVPSDVQKTVVMVFSTARARDVAQVLLAQRIAMRAIIIAPEKLATDEWVRQATRYCRDSAVHYLSRNTLNEPLKFLALADELCVINNNTFVEKLSAGAEDLLWLALELGMDATYFGVNRRRLGNPETSLERRGAPARVEARRARRVAFTRKLKEIRLMNDFGSSGLWNRKGKMLRYDQLDLPFPLIRRIALWQRDCEDTATHPNEASDEWRGRHNQETVEIARELQAALGSEITVKFHVW